MDNINYIKNRLSLRPPQSESLEILASILDDLDINNVTSSDLKDLEQKLSKYGKFKEFEREFISICFSLATGVGKTRLMGAFITYLYLEKEIKNFFILAPNLTVYNKLIDDFSNTSSEKYVFKGIHQFINIQPRIITGDNYDEVRQFSFSEININIFNISKINAESKGGKEPKIKRLSEYIGESYFSYLSNLSDLVLLMDESHHYRADRGMQVINELNPLIGIEVTATPKIEKNSKSIEFKNVVYEYNLGKAIRDGYVKEPSVATRRDFDSSQYNDDELDKIKLIDAINLHRDTKLELEKYAKDNDEKLIKPFVLIVAKDVEHSKSLKEYIISNEFYEGAYADKVMEVNSSQKGDEKEENIDKLLSLESINNNIEIVIHVNMLKEGWDVTNLYTIVPLRASVSTILTEQTIGRGLRLPYGKRTGNNKVDRLTIVSHDKYQKIIEEANKPDSLINCENIIEINDKNYSEKELVTSKSIVENNIDENLIIDNNPSVKDLDISKKMYDTIIDMNKDVENIHDLASKDIKLNVIESIKKEVSTTNINGNINKILDTLYDNIVESIIKQTISIPRITIEQKMDTKYEFSDFDLDDSKLNYHPSDNTILITELSSGKKQILKGNKETIKINRIEDIIVDELTKNPDVNYDENAELLYKLAEQAIKKFKQNLTEEDVCRVVVEKKKDIANNIYIQMKNNINYNNKEFVAVNIMPFDRIYPNNFTKDIGDRYYNFRETIEPLSDIPKKIFEGFEKSCHNLYKFDSNPEKIFSIILEDDDYVEKWLRPASKQFNIYWDEYKTQKYEPDFIVETEEYIYMVEPKMNKELKSEEVRLKSLAALKYCNAVNQHNKGKNNKEWKYILIPHDKIELNSTFKYLAETYEQSI